MAGTGICDFYTPAGEMDPTKVATLTGIIENDEREQARVCAEVTQCSTDDGAASKFADDPKDLIVDHLTITGQAKEAALLWPTVQKVIG